MTEFEAAEVLNLSVRTLRRWRFVGRGPQFRKLGASVRYPVADLLEWVNASPAGAGDAGVTTGALKAGRGRRAA